MSKPPLTHKIIESGFAPGQSARKEIEVFGEAGAIIYQNLLYRLMDSLCAGAYHGGVWTMVEYEDGSVAWLFPNDTQIPVSTFNGYDVTCSMESVSIAANIIAHSALMGELCQKPNFDEDAVDRIAQNFSQLQSMAQRLPEAAAIRRIID